MEGSGAQVRKSSLGHRPEGAWAFDETVTDVFDDMLERSIPQYRVMREACVEIAASHFQDGTSIIDLGCSRGEALWTFRQRFGGRATELLGLEISDPMLAAARERFEGVGQARIEKKDLREDLTLPPSSIVLSVLTLMFVPINHRQRLLRRVYQSLKPGGALVLVEKVLGGSASIDARMVKVYHELKKANGYTDEEVRRKALSLEGVLVPVTARMNEEFLRNAGFHEIDTFWRWMNFCGWVAVK